MSTGKKLQGPRPTTLKVNKFSSAVTKIKKPASGSWCRSPVIIYLVSPKVIHARPEEFKGLVQRLTGKQAPLPPSSCREMEKHNRSVINEVKNDVEDRCVSSSLAPSDGLAAYSSFCIDFCPDWDEF